VSTPTPESSLAGEGPGVGVSGLLAVHAHPDDETLATGALLATWAAAGLPVTVVTCTRGERGEVIGAELAHLEGDGPALAAHREVELAAALAALGVRDHAFLDGGASPDERYEDSGMAWLAPGQAGSAADVPDRAFVGVDVEVAARRLADLLDERRPAVVVTYEPGGGYGHPDHVRAHQVTMRAVDLADVAPVVLWAAQGSSALRSAMAVLSTVDGLALPDASAPLPSVAVPDDDVDLLVDVVPVLDCVLAALRAHATQVQAVAALDAPPAVARYALSNDVLAPIPAAEGYRIARPGPFTAWPAGVTTA